MDTGKYFYKGRRGVVYSLITLLLVMPLMVFLIMYVQTANSEDELAALKIRGIEISNFANSVNEDVPRYFKITAKRALISAINQIDVDGKPLDDAQRRIVELMLNATINGTGSVFMNASSLTDWAVRMKAIGARFGFNTTITFIYLNVTPYDSFNIQFDTVLMVNATDADGIVSINRVYNQTYVMSIEGYEDVLYSLNTKGFVQRNYAKASYNITNVTYTDMAIAQKAYVPSNDGASFLDRMENKTYIQPKYANATGRTIGLESFVDIAELTLSTITIKPNQTVVDHLYFNASAVGGCPVVGSNYSWFRLDTTHATLFNVTTQAC